MLRPALPGVIGLTVVAAFSFWRGHAPMAVLALFAAFFLVQVAVTSPAGMRRLTRVIEAIAHGVGVVLTVVLLGLTWLAVVVPVALLNRLLRIDLLASDGGRGWHPAAAVEWVRRAYRREPRRRGATGRRVLRVAVVLLALGLVARAVVDKANTVPTASLTPFGASSTAAVEGVVYHDRWLDYQGKPVSRHLFPGEPWGREVLEAQQPPAPCDALNPVYRDPNPNFDFESRYVNVVDGSRRTLSLGRPEQTVWMFGGSTTFGVGQRDEHTIASDLVRLAAAEGIALEVVNISCPGEVNWVETNQFAERLRLGLPPPDAAIFLDGINEWSAGFDREQYGLLDPSVPFTGVASREHQRELLADARARGYEETHDLDRQVDLVAEQYRRGVERGRALSEAYGVPVVHFWQPALFTMPPDAPGNPTVMHNNDMVPASTVEAGDHYSQVPDRSGVDPIDITDIFDEATQPLYFDCCHTNEEGARIEAAAMWPYVRDTL